MRIQSREDALNYVEEFSLYYDGHGGDEYVAGLRTKTKPATKRRRTPYYKVTLDGKVFSSVCTNRLTNLLWEYAEGLYGECPEMEE